MSANIVIVEDEEDLLELLEYNLQKEGYETIGFLKGPFKNLCQSGKITNTQGKTHENRSRCRVIC